MRRYVRWGLGTFKKHKDWPDFPRLLEPVNCILVISTCWPCFSHRRSLLVPLLVCFAQVWRCALAGLKADNETEVELSFRSRKQTHVAGYRTCASELAQQRITAVLRVRRRIFCASQSHHSPASAIFWNDLLVQACALVKNLERRKENENELKVVACFLCRHLC